MEHNIFHLKVLAFKKFINRINKKKNTKKMEWQPYIFK